MAKSIQEKSLRINKEPIVIFPLKKWEKIKELIEEGEDAARFAQAFFDSKNQKLISFEKVKKKLNLP